MMKTNAVLLACITLFFIIDVNVANAKERSNRDYTSNGASSGKQGVRNAVVGTGQERCYGSSGEIRWPESG